MTTIMTRNGLTLGEGLTIPGFSGFSQAERQRFATRSNLNSYEFNYRIKSLSVKDQQVLQPNGMWIREAAPSRLFTCIGGLVFMQVHERASYESWGANPNTNSGRYVVKTDNDLLGIQLGGGWTELYTDWQCGFRGRGGLLINFASRKSDLDYIDGEIVGDRYEQKTKEHLTAMIQLGVHASYFLRPNVALKTSYDVLYLQGLALAPENMRLDDAGFPNIYAGGYGLYHGLSMGVEMTW